MKYRPELAAITMADLCRLADIRTALRAVYEAIAATSMQAKPAVLAWLDKADDDAQAIFRKGARRALKLGAQGAYERLHLSAEFIAELVQAAGISDPQGDESTEGEADAPAVDVLEPPATE